MSDSSDSNDQSSNSTTCTTASSSPVLETAKMDKQITLPPEILLQLFKYLTAEDRKNVRCVCKSWLKWCSHRSITQNEIHVFRPGATTADMDATLSRGQNEHLNFEFQYMLRTQSRLLPIFSFEQFGYKVREIILRVSVQVPKDTFKCIIVNCVNLTSIRIYNQLPASFLDDLIEKNIRRPQLETFETYFPYSQNELVQNDTRPIVWSTVRKLFIIFPCLKHFGISYYGHYEIGEMVGETAPRKSVIQLESLLLTVRSHYCWLEKPIIPVLDHRLTKFETALTNVSDENLKNTLFKFFAAQENLKTISLIILSKPIPDVPRIFVDDVDFAKEVIMHLLENCPNLRDLAYRRYTKPVSDVMFTLDECSRFIAGLTKLQSFITNFTFRTRHRPFIPSNNLTLNLHTLRVPSCVNKKHNNLRIFSVLLKCCPNMTHLRFNYPSEENLRHILSNMTNLRSLMMSRYTTDEDSVFTHRDASGELLINRLQRLEILSTWLGASDCASELRLPELKHLTLERCHQSHERVCKILKNLPTLQSFIIDLIVDSDEKCSAIIEACKHATKLQYMALPFRNEDYPTLAQMTAHFETCPCLRYVLDDHKNVLYYRQPSTKEILKEIKVSKKHFEFPTPKNVFSMHTD